MALEKVRIYALAKALDVESTELVRLCQRHGIDVKNQLSSLDAEQKDFIVDLIQKGGLAPQSPVVPKGVPASKIPDPVREIRKIPTLVRSKESPRPPAETDQPPESAEPTHEPAVPAAGAAREPAPVPAPVETTPAPAAEVKPSLEVEKPVAPLPEPEAPPTPAPVKPAAAAPPPLRPEPPPLRPAATETTPAPAKPAAAAPPPLRPEPPPLRPAATETPPPEQPAPPAPPVPSAPPPLRPTPPPQLRPTLRPDRPMRTLGGGSQGGNRPQGSPRPQGTPPPPQRRDQGRPVPGGSRPPGMGTPMPTPRGLAGQKAPPPPPAPAGPKKIGEIPPELQGTGKPIRIEDLIKYNRQQSAAAATGAAPLADTPDLDDDDGPDKGKKKPGAVGPGGIPGRNERHQQRSARQKDRQAQEQARGGKVLLADDDDRPRAKTLVHKLRKQRRGTMPRKGNVPIAIPITVRSLSEAIGIKSGEVLMWLLGQGVKQNITINSVLEPEIAELFAAEKGCELDIKRPLDMEQEVLKGIEQPDNPDDLAPRAPIVTIMGHVDHGKTSLLDRIRDSEVAKHEAGGITQSIRAWRVEHAGKYITFIDTPGHEAFTKMRARGANVTDIAVIVVAADDGVMPQTEEAVNHAKAAGVKIIVALNKIDLPNANIPKALDQLYRLGLYPDNMGGDIPFIHTSAATGKGIDDLLEAISLVSELSLELQANPKKAARGTCLEASVNEGEGVMATMLVQDGTLHRGDVIVCGASHGRIRALYDDLGHAIEEAGPSVPCRLTGLDIIPNADDPFVGVSELAVAREIAEKRLQKQEQAALVPRQAMRLESMGELKVTELKVILKADVRGSLEAIKKELEKLRHDEVRVRVLHDGIGGINESDVTLALIAPTETVVVGFNVVPDDAAQDLAERNGIQIREYKIIYELTNDVRASLEGKLKPREEVVHLGRAVVRDTFKISRVGTIAGCYITQGSIERSAKVRVIRNGIVVYPPGEKQVGLDSLKRFKEDVREVQQGFECGIKVAGYDDIKSGDIIEAYRIDQVQRTLS